MGFALLSSLAGAASYAILWNLDPSPSDAPAYSRAQRAEATLAQTEDANFAFASEALEAERSAFLFGGPTSLGAFSQRAAPAPVLASRFTTLMADAPAAVQPPAKIVIVAVSTQPTEIPLPTANPFRQQAAPLVSPAATQTATRKPARATVVAAAKPVEEKGFLERLFGAGEQRREPALAYAPTDTNEVRGWPGSAPQTAPARSEKTAIYDISSKTVLMPNGERLEAHSGLGDLLDDPRSTRMKNRGVTPPNVYNLRLRESLFHGVQAIRLVPLHENLMFGRDGILAHTYMLGPGGDSNGCVSFRDYDAFLRAFLRGEVTRLVVAERASAAPALLASIR